MFKLLNILIMEFKLWVFTKKIKKYRKTKVFKVISSTQLTNFWSDLLAAILGLGLFLVSAFALFFVTYFVVFLISLIIKFSQHINVIISLIVAVVGGIGNIIIESIRHSNKYDDKYTQAMQIILQYLIEIKRGNTNIKIYKGDLSYIFMNVQRRILFIIRDIQDNIYQYNESVDEKNKCEINKVIDREVLFLITYIREQSGMVDPVLKYDFDDEDLIKDIIDNSSVKTIKSSMLRRLRNKKNIEERKNTKKD